MSYFSGLEILKTTFKAPNIFPKGVAGKGYFLLLRSESSAVVNQSSFDGGRANAGGAIYLEDGS